MKRFFKIFAIAALALGFTACDEPSEGVEGGEVNITLTGDKREIVANGIDAVTFTALVNGKANSDIQIFCLKNNSLVKNNTFTTIEAGDYLFKAVYNNKSSEPFKVTAVAPIVPTLYLLTDKQEIIANGTDVVTFTVKLDDEDVTAESIITNVTTNATLEGTTFSTDTANEYTFVAKYGEYTSAERVITAVAEVPVQKALTLKASKMRIKSNGEDKVVFTAKYGEEDVTASCTLHTTTGAAIEGNEFTTTTAGTYNIYAIYEETKRSNTLSIDAYDPDVVGQYDIGTVCEVDNTKGVVYAIKNNKVYVVSLDEALLQWSTENVWCNCISGRGDYNTEDMLRFGTSPDKYPAAQWCLAHGENWYLPSSTELQWLWDVTSGGKHEYNCDEMKAFNKILTDNGGTAIGEDYYWSSNETSEDLIEFVAFMRNSVICADPQKTSKMLTRAITRFDI